VDSSARQASRVHRMVRYADSPYRMVEHVDTPNNMVEHVDTPDNMVENEVNLVNLVGCLHIGMATGRGGDGFRYPIPIPA